MQFNRKSFSSRRKTGSKKARLLTLFFTGLCISALCAIPVWAAEGETDIPTDPGNGQTITTDDPKPELPNTSSSPGQTPDPSSSSPAVSSEPDLPSSSTPQSSSPEVSTPSSSNSDSWESASSASSSPWEEPDSSSGTVSEEDPNTTSSDYYVEWNPNNSQNENNYHDAPPATNTNPPAPIAQAQEDDRSELSSQDWNELLGLNSYQANSGDASNPASNTYSLPDIAVGGIFRDEGGTGGGVSTILIIGIIALILGAAGIAFFIYSQFIYKGRKPKLTEDTHSLDYDGYDDDYDYDPNEPPYGSASTYRESFYSQHEDTAPLSYDEDPNRDIRSHSDATPSQTSPGDSDPPKSTEEKMKEIDWDKFFKGHQ